MGLVKEIYNAKHDDILLSSTPAEFDKATLGFTALYGLEVDNTNNSADSYVKIYDAASAPSIGTDVPDVCILRVDAGKKQAFFPFGPNGRAITNDIFIACVTAGGTAGSTSPAYEVKADVYTD